MSPQVSIRLFGMLAEKANWSEGSIPLPSKDINDLKSFFEEHIPELKGMDFSIAIDQKVVSTYKSVEKVSEIALLPPFAGG